MSFKNLDVWKLVRELVIEIHKMTLTKLPKTGSLADKVLYVSLHDKLEILGRKLNLLIQSVTKGHISEK